MTSGSSSSSSSFFDDFDAPRAALTARFPFWPTTFLGGFAWVLRLVAKMRRGARARGANLHSVPGDNSRAEGRTFCLNLRGGEKRVSPSGFRQGTSGQKPAVWVREAAGSEGRTTNEAENHALWPPQEKRGFSGLGLGGPLHSKERRLRRMGKKGIARSGRGLPSERERRRNSFSSVRIGFVSRNGFVGSRDRGSRFYKHSRYPTRPEWCSGYIHVAVRSL